MPFYRYATLGAWKKRRRKYAASRIQRAFRRRKKRSGLQRQITTLKKKVNSQTEYGWQDIHNYSDSFGVAGLVKSVGLDNIAITPTSANLQDNRIGNTISLRSIYLKGQIAVGDSHNFCRMLLVQVLSLSTTVNISDILQPQFGSVLCTIYSPYRKESDIKFKVLHDKFYKTQIQAAGSVYPSIVNFDLSYKWKNGLKISYLQDAASTPLYNNLVLVCISDSNLTPHPSFRSFKRLSWIK